MIEILCVFAGLYVVVVLTLFTVGVVWEKIDDFRNHYIAIGGK